jgi:hypothetical protein
LTRRGPWDAKLLLLSAALLTPSAGAGGAESLDWQPVMTKDAPALAYAIGIGREDNLPLYACRARAGAGVQPGRYRGDFTGCHIGYGGQEVSVTPFEVLASGWQDEANGNIPPASLVSGQRALTGSGTHFNLAPLYSCRATYQNSIQVGEIAAGDRGCRFGFGGRQVTELKYQVLWDAPWMTWIPGVVRQLPADAIVAGSEGGEAFYICRAGDRTGLHPGKVKQSSPGCAFASEGQEIVAPQFSVLVPRWVAGNAGTIPVTALPVGNERQDLIYLCRAQMRDTVQIGKMTEQFTACHVGAQGGENTSQAYDILSER